jgi:uncharacterized oxidoreductase
MKTTNTILITGGYAGTGKELAVLLAKKGNRVIITGKDRNKLYRAAFMAKNSTGIQCDVTDTGQAEELVKKVSSAYPGITAFIHAEGEAYFDGLDSLAENEALVLQHHLAGIAVIKQLHAACQKQEKLIYTDLSALAADYLPPVLANTIKAQLQSYLSSRACKKATNLEVIAADAIVAGSKTRAEAIANHITASLDKTQSRHDFGTDYHFNQGDSAFWGLSF